MVTKIINKIQYLFKSEDQELELSTPINTSVEFELTYKNLVIGVLKLNNGLWAFTYSEAFKHQNEINAIVDFPDKHKVYQSNVLFPFFAFRIPSLQRLKLQHVISDSFTNDEVSLLKMFGKQTIANPYQLISMF
jgi:HipA-like protein